MPVTALAGDNGGTARANLHPANQSGVNARINFVAVDGASFALNGTATGLEESFGRYVSLVYDNGSVPGGPNLEPGGGPLTGLCEPTDNSIDDLMFVGIWDVDGAGNGTLIIFGPGAPLGSYDTVSIRDTTVNDGFGTAAIVACGQVAVHSDG